MPIICTVCRHERRPEIDGALLAGEPFRTLAKRTGTSVGALFRHRHQHISVALMKAKDVAEVVQADSLMDKITLLEQEARRLGKKAENAGDLRAAMGAVRELVRIVELLAKIQGELKDPQGTIVQVVYVNASGPSKSDKPIASTQSSEIVEVVAVRPAELAQE